MAPFGSPRYVDKVWKLIRVQPDGSFELDMDYFAFHHSTYQTFSRKFEALFGPPRDPRTNFFTPSSGYPSYFGERPTNYDELARQNEHYADIAASIQAVTEEAAWGEEHSPVAVQRFLERNTISHEHVDDEAKLVERVVDRLERGKVVGWCQGRFEWGPRALGQRSILADPRRADMKHLVNLKIKLREPFRPFRPSVL